MFDIEIVEPTATAPAPAEAPVEQAATPVAQAPANAAADEKFAKLEADYAALAAKVAAVAPAPAAAQEEPESEVDYFLDPKGAVEKAASAAVDKALAAKADYDSRVRAEAGKVAAAYPDAGAVMASPEFGAFLKSNPALASAYEGAKANLSGEGIANTIGLFKKLAGVPAATVADPVAANTSDVVNLEGGAPGATGNGKVWSRAEIQRIAMNDPDRYDALGPEIARAYAENRVTA